MLQWLHASAKPRPARLLLGWSFFNHCAFLVSVLRESLKTPRFLVSGLVRVSPRQLTIKMAGRNIE